MSRPERPTAPLDAVAPEVVDAAGRALVRLALQEDLAGFGDVTSAWTVPAGAVARARVVAREEAVVSGLPLAAAVFAEVDSTVVFTPLVAEGSLVAAGRRARRGDRPGARRARRRTRGAELPDPPVRRGDAGPSLRAGGRRDRGDGGRHPQDDCGPALLGEAGRAPRGVRQPPLRALRHGADQGQPPGRGRRRRRGRDRRARGGSLRHAGRGRGRGREPACARRSPPVPTSSCSTTCRPPSCGAAWRSRAGCGPTCVLEASGGVTLATVRAVAETGVDVVSSGSLTSGAPPVDLGLDFA